MRGNFVMMGIIWGQNRGRHTELRGGRKSGVSLALLCMSMQSGPRYVAVLDSVAAHQGWPLSSLAAPDPKRVSARVWLQAYIAFCTDGMQ